jgi:hypothetical protein
MKEHTVKAYERGLENVKSHKRGSGSTHHRPFKRGENMNKGEDALTEIRNVYLYIRENPGTKVKTMREETTRKRPLKGNQRYFKSRWPGIREYLHSSGLVFAQKVSKRLHLYYPTDPNYEWPIEAPVDDETPEKFDPLLDRATSQRQFDTMIEELQTNGHNQEVLDEVQTEKQVNGPNEDLDDVVDHKAPRVSMGGQYTDSIEITVLDSGGNIVQTGTFGSIADVAIENIGAATLRCAVTRTSEGRSVVRLEVHLS